MPAGEELKRNEKERAEHVMLVDLGRNESAGSAVRIGARAAVSWGSGALLARDAPDLDRRKASSPTIGIAWTPWVVLPAGTVSGAPKVRAMRSSRSSSRQDAASTRRRQLCRFAATSISASPFGP